ncbi:hypothetical protein ACFVFI_33555 [Streptomyces sp. NPDC057705]|uniref:hypothetical protein n=1 Tax=Streptomyces sp. NPDC057705 TaxID=3346222 RepID=UPI0036A83E03
MTTHGLKRRMSALTTVLALGIALPFALAAPAQAAPTMSISKSHEGTFTRGGQGLYHIALTVSGEGGLSDITVTDNLPTGLTVDSLGGDFAIACQAINSGTTVQCGNFSIANFTATLDVVVNIANDAPCSVINTVTATSLSIGSASDSDQTTVPGGGCNGEGGEGGSILPINLNGTLTLFNNINTSNNINSPGASNTNHQVFGLNAS